MNFNNILQAYTQFPLQNCFEVPFHTFSFFSLKHFRDVLERAAWAVYYKHSRSFLFFYTLLKGRSNIVIKFSTVVWISFEFLIVSDIFWISSPTKEEKTCSLRLDTEWIHLENRVRKYFQHANLNQYLYFN